MPASIESISELERRLSISIPSARVDQLVNEKLNEIYPTVKLNGFRPGKVPRKLLEERYYQPFRADVMDKLINEELMSLLKENNVTPVTNFEWDLKKGTLAGEDIECQATFEVAPHFDWTQLEKISVEKPDIEISDADIDEVIEGLRKQRSEWQVVERAANAGEQIIINFIGRIDGTPFEGGQAKQFAVEIGAKRMIPGFEEGLIGAKAGDTLQLPVTFPADYHVPTLAGKAAVFEINVIEVKAPELPPVDEFFVKDLGIESGDIAELRNQIKERLTTDGVRYLAQKNRETLSEKLAEIFSAVNLPKRLIKDRIHQMLHSHDHAQEHGHEHHDHQHDHATCHHKEEDVTPEMKQQAERQVLLELLFSQYIQHHQIKPDNERIRDELMRLADNYVRPEEMLQWYQKNQQLLDMIRSRVFEEQVFDDMLNKVNRTDKKYAYKDLTAHSSQ